MDEINTLQPKLFRDIGPQLFAPRDDEDVVPNPFAIPPEWLAVWQEEADDRAAMEAAAGAAKDAEDASKAKTDASKNDKNDKKTDGIIASLSAAIPKFFQGDKTPDKKASGVFDELQGALTGALSGLGTQAGALGQQAGQQAGTGAGQGLLDSLKAGIPGVISTAQQAVEPAVQQIVTGAVQSAKPGVADLAHTAGQHATAGAQEQFKAGGTGIGVDTTTLVVGGVAVLGALGLGAWLLSGDKRFGAFESNEEFQKMLDKASWTRPAGNPAVKWLDTPQSTRAVSVASPQKNPDSGLGAGLAIVGTASAMAIFAGYYLKNKLDADKKASGAYGTGLSGSSPSGAISRRSAWWRSRQAGSPGSPLVMRSSPLHPFTLADSLGMSKELLHLDPTVILGSNPAQKDHDDFFTGYPVGHSAGSANCDAARLGKGGTVYMKDASKSQAWDNGWLKGYYDGWIAEGCKATLPHTKTSSGPDYTWSYIFTYMDGTTTTDSTPTPNSQVAVTDNLVPDTARGSKAVKVERVRFPDNLKVTVWTADKGASGPPPAVGLLPGLASVLLPWQMAAAAKYKATHPNFGNDYQEMIRVLAITPAQIAKANTQYKPFAGADAAAAAQDPGSPWVQSVPSGGQTVDDGSND
jgi:hypothetical protein